MEDTTTNTTPSTPVNNNGKSHTLTNLVIILAVVAIAALGWWTFNNATATTTDSVTQKSIPEVNKENDLAAAESFLTNGEIDTILDTSEIDSALN